MKRAGGIVARLGVAGPALLLAAPAWAQRLGQAEGGDVPVWRVIAALLFCLALAGGAALLLRRRFGGFAGFAPRRAGAERRLRLQESLRLSHNADLCLVSCDGAEILVAATPHGVTVIGPVSSGAAAEPRP